MNVRSLPIVFFACLAGAACSNCSKTSDEHPAAMAPSAPTGTVVAPLTVTSTAFAEGSALPPRFTCEGDGISPPLAWSAPPPATKSVAVIVEDPDAPSKTFTHWIVYDLAPGVRSLPEGAKNAPAGARDGTNDFGKVGYGGPCPPKGTHHYVFRVFALDATLGLDKLHASDLASAMNGHVLAEGALTATYTKGQGSRS